MEVFVYNADQPREELEQFNERVQAFCMVNPVVVIGAQTLGPSLLLSLTTASDVDDIDFHHTLMPFVQEADGADLQLEEQVTETLDFFAQLHLPEDVRIAYESQAVPRSDMPSRGFILTRVITGSLEYEDDEDG